MGVTVRPAGAGDVEAATASLAAAFQDDPVNRWWIADPADRAGALPKFFRFAIEKLYLRFEHVYVADDAAGAAAWCPPGRWKLSDEETATFAPNFLDAIGPEYLQRGAMLLGMVEEVHPERPHWYLPFIGVRPDRQGQGLGSALLRQMTARFDTEGSPAYLESSTERNRDLYLRHGFEVTRELPLPEGGPTMWLMWREPGAGA